MTILYLYCLPCFRIAKELETSADKDTCIDTRKQLAVKVTTDTVLYNQCSDFRAEYMCYICVDLKRSGYENRCSECDMQSTNHSTLELDQILD